MARLFFVKSLQAALLVIILLSLFGCAEDRNEPLQQSIDSVPRVAIFDPSNSVIPFPNNLLFFGTTDGSLNIPVVDTADLSDPKVAMNSLDGFSTSSTLTTTFSTPIDATTIPGNVRLFSVTIDDFNSNPAGPTFAVLPEPLGVVTELVFGPSADFVATVSTDTTTLVIVPMKPLAPKSGYMVVISKGLADIDGKPYSADLTYALTKEQTSLINIDGTSKIAALSDEQAQALEPLRLLTGAAETAVSDAIVDLDRSNIILSWSFTTQSTSDVLNIAKAVVPTTPTLGAFTSHDPSLFGLPSSVAIYSATIDVPYFLASGVAALSGSWKGFDGQHLSLLNGKTPIPTETLTIPLLVTLPSAAAMDASSIPVIIYQHGITLNRSTVLALAGTMAGIGAAIVAIDLPLHGLTPDDVAFSQLYDAANERTFGLDLIDVTGAPVAGGDGTIDASGAHFINLRNLQTTRDNVRQAIFDLFVLNKSIATMDVDGNGADFDSNNVSFIGHSLGAIVGVPFLALEPSIKEGVIAMGGGGIAKVLDGSATYGPTIAAGLAASGLNKGTADYESYFLAAQTMLDSVDPLNYGADAVASHNILALEIVGNTASTPPGTSPSDLVIPNRVPDGNDSSGTVASPLAGTEPLIGPMVMGLTQKDATAVDAAGLDIVIKYTAGHHGSLLTPANNSGNTNVISTLEVTTQIHTNVSSFLATAGQQVIVDDASIIEPVPVP